MLNRLNTICRIMMLASIGLWALNAQALQTPDDEVSVDIVIKPRKPAIDILEEYLAGDDYSADVHTTLAIDAAGEAFKNQNYNAADRLLSRTLKRGQKDPSWTPSHSAAILEARSDVVAQFGDSRDSLRHILRAQSAIENYASPEARARMRLKVAYAYLRRFRADPNTNGLRSASKQLERLARDESAPQTFRDVAWVYQVMMCVEMSCSVQGGIDDLASYIDTAKHDDQRLPATIAAGYLFDHYRKLGDQEKADKYSVLLQQEGMGFSKPEFVSHDGVDKVTVSGSTLKSRLPKSGVGVGNQVDLNLDTASKMTMARDYHSFISGNFVDVSYCVDQQGDVYQTQIVSKRGDKDWLERMTTFIEAQQFTPTATERSDRACFHRFERFAVVSENKKYAGSNLLMKSPELYITRTDLKDNPLATSLLHIQ